MPAFFHLLLAEDKQYVRQGDREKVEKKLASMTLDEKVGQMLQINLTELGEIDEALSFKAPSQSD